MGTATNRIQVGTWIGNIYLRHSYTCTQGAALISNVTGGHFILGLGVSHQPVNLALGIEMPDPPATLRRYIAEVRIWLRGEGPAMHLPQRAADPPVPLYISALTSRVVEMASEVADGIIPLFWSMERGAGLAGLSDRLLDAVCLLDPLSHCRDRLATYRAAGPDLPILMAPIGVDGARAVIRAFQR